MPTSASWSDNPMMAVVVACTSPSETERRTAPDKLGERRASTAPERPAGPTCFQDPAPILPRRPSTGLLSGLFLAGRAVAALRGDQWLELIDDRGELAERSGGTAFRSRRSAPRARRWANLALDRLGRRRGRPTSQPTSGAAPAFDVGENPGGHARPSSGAWSGLDQDRFESGVLVGLGREAVPPGGVKAAVAGDLGHHHHVGPRADQCATGPAGQACVAPADDGRR